MTLYAIVVCLISSVFQCGPTSSLISCVLCVDVTETLHVHGLDMSIFIGLGYSYTLNFEKISREIVFFLSICHTFNVSNSFGSMQVKILKFQTQ